MILCIHVLFEPIFTPFIKFNYHGSEVTFGSRYTMLWKIASCDSLERSPFGIHEWSFKDMWFLKRGLFFLVIEEMQHSKLVDSSRHASQLVKKSKVKTKVFNKPCLVTKIERTLKLKGLHEMHIPPTNYVILPFSICMLYVGKLSKDNL